MLTETNFFLPIYGIVLRENLDIPSYSVQTGYICHEIIQNEALLAKIQILMTFEGPNLQVFLGRDLEENIPGNQLLGHLNIVPERNIAISLHFSCSEN